MVAFNTQSSFLTEQKKYSRVRSAFTEKEKTITENITKSGFNISDFHILIIAYKAEQELEIYAKSKKGHTYHKVISYPVCATSGQLGPKRKQGDRQVPEGFYHIDRFNPASNYYLSLGINYPNESDKRKSNSSNLGGDIFIHGSCVTIGCLPMTDDKIKEIYLYATLARENGQLNIPVYIFPFKMNDSNFSDYEQKYASKPDLLAFWHTLKKGYDIFDREKNALKILIDKQGNYILE